MCVIQAGSGQGLRQRALRRSQGDEARGPHRHRTKVPLSVRTVSCIVITPRPQMTPLRSSTAVDVPDCTGVPQPCIGKAGEANE